MEPQEIYNQVKKHLLKQNEKSTNDGYCVYRSEKGLKCAIGGILPDDLYHESMDKMMDSIIGIMSNFPRVKEYFGRGNENLLRELQIIHDDYEPNAWHVKLIYVAKMFNLDFGEKE